MVLESIFLTVQQYIPKIISLLLGILGIGFLIGFHEFGHFIFCKIFNIKTPTFSIGMGPQITQKKMGGTNFVLSAIPMGGFVEIEPESMYHQSWLKKMAVISGGIIFNLIFAYGALWFLFYRGLPETILTYPKYATLTISKVAQNSPAERAGLHAGQTIIAASSIEETLSPKNLLEFIIQHPGKTIDLTVEENGKTETIPLAIAEKEITTTNTQQCPEQNQKQGYAGIGLTMRTFSFLEAKLFALQTTYQMAILIFEGLKNIFSKKGLKTIGGPLMVIAQTAQGAAKGAHFFIFILALMSVNLAVLNVLPLPIMDGGQALITTIESLFLKRPMNDKAKNYIFIASWILIIALLGILSIKDIISLLF